MKISKNKSFELSKIKIEPSEENLSAIGGLGALLHRFDESFLSEEFKRNLPERKSPRSLGAYRLALVQLGSFIQGHDCLDDLDEFREDPYLEKLMRGQSPSPRTMGDFLRDFSEENIEGLNQFLNLMSETLRGHLQQVIPEEYHSKHLVIDIDSTDHVQTGEKMEGVEWNYRGNWCLDSQVAFDEYGLCHGMQLRKGSTKSGVGAEELLENIFKKKKFREKKYFRGDSAYCEQDILRTCVRLGVTFVVAAHDTYTNWKEKRKEITDWKPWEYTEKELERSKKTGKPLPKVEMGRTYWSPGWAPQLKFPMLIKRTWKEGARNKKESQTRLPFDLESSGYWEYYGLVTNENLFERSYQEVFEFYKKRGNAERFIREEKYGYDLKHFPCQKLRANQAFGLLAMTAHNLLRWGAIIERPDKPNFSKKLRRRLIHIPGKLLVGQNQKRLKIPKRFYKEVMRWIDGMTEIPIKPLLDTC